MRASAAARVVRHFSGALLALRCCYFLLSAPPLTPSSHPHLVLRALPVQWPLALCCAPAQQPWTAPTLLSALPPTLTLPTRMSTTGTVASRWLTRTGRCVGREAARARALALAEGWPWPWPSLLPAAASASPLTPPHPSLLPPCPSPLPLPPLLRLLQEWSDLPAPYKYLHVKVNPKDVENAGFFGKVMDAMYDWKLAVPMALLVAMPLWMTGNLPGFDERLELSLITILAGTAISREVAPMFKAMKTSSLEAKNKCVAAVAVGPTGAPPRRPLTPHPLSLPPSLPPSLLSPPQGPVRG
jgi:hypothetical protein